MEPIVNEKKKKLAYVKGIDLEKKTVSGYVSTYEWDRMEERFAQGAWDMKNFMKNPVVLWGHNTTQFPVGRNLSMEEDDKGLFAVTEFNQKDEFAMRVFQLFADRYMNAFSVGFIPKSFVLEPMPGMERKGLVWTEAELYEYSAVPVPANPGALISRELAELVMKTVGPRYVEVLATKSLGEQFLVVPKEKAEEDETPALAPAPEEPNLEGSLKGIITLANAAKGSKVPEQTRSLILTATTVFNEILSEQKEEITEDEMKTLGEAMKQFASVVQAHNPEAAELVQKSISKIEVALRGRVD